MVPRSLAKILAKLRCWMKELVFCHVAGANGTAIITRKDARVYLPLSGIIIAKHMQENCKEPAFQQQMKYT